jgi:transposase
MGKVTNYTPEYKKEIIKLVTEQSKSRGEVAESIGVSKTTISDWINKYSVHGNNAFPGRGYLRPEEKEFRDLKKKVKDLEEENAILKKAMRIFSRDVK